MTPSPRRLALVVSGCLLGPTLAGCGSAPGRSVPTGVDGLEIPTAAPDPRDFVDGIDNPYLPLAPGSRWTYESSSDDGDEVIIVTVTDRTRVVAGVRVVVVHDRVTDARGSLVEETDDWFAQDRAGNVWYFGEDTTAYDDGSSTGGSSTGGPSTDGSWEAGVDGAEAGVVMLAAPRVGDGYRQESAPGEAEDRGEVLAIDSEVSLDLESFNRVVEIADTTPLEPSLVEHEYYAAGVGLVLKKTVTGGDDLVVLVEYTR